MSLLDELRRRQVIRVVLAYIAGAWLLIQVLETLLPVFGLPQSWIRTAVILVVIGLVPVVILSWLFELTPGGIAKDSGMPADGDSTGRAAHGLDRAIIVMLTLAVAYFAIDKFVLAPATGSPELDAAQAKALAFAQRNPRDDTSLAVLPFAISSAEETQRSFADGLTEEILYSLAAIDGLRVTSRTSSFAFRDRAQPLPQVAAVLGVGYILDGSVRRSGDRIRVSAQLIDASVDAQIWVESYDRNVTVENVLDIQQDIAMAVANAMQLEVLPVASAAIGSRQPKNLATLELYRDGLYYAHKISPLDADAESNAERAIEKFSAAIQLDPDWAPPYAMLGNLYHTTREMGEDATARLALARVNVDRALALDPEFAPAHASLGYLLGVDGEFEAALDSYNRALAMGFSDAHIGRAILYRILGQHEKAIADYHAAAATDPLDDIIRYQLFETYYCAGRYDSAIAGYEEFFPDPDYPRLLIVLANSYAREGDVANALTLVERFVTRTNMEAPVASAIALAGQAERARQAVSAWTRDEPFLLLDIAPAAVILGDRELALDLLEQAIMATEEFDESDMLNVRWQFQCRPEIRELAGDPRYSAILERLDLPGQFD